MTELVKNCYGERKCISEKGKVREMRTEKAIGIDIGTTSICLAGYRMTDGKTEKILQEANTFLPGTFLQDPQRIYRCVKMMLDEILDRIDGADVIGVSSQMHGIVYLDENGNAVTPYYTWKTECGNELFLDSTYAKGLSGKTGYEMHTGYGSVTHFYLQKTGQIPENAAVFSNIGDYIVMQLCGLEQPRMHPSIAASMGGFNLKNGSFDKEKLQKAGINTVYYPEVTSKVQVAGKYRGIPVAWALGDNQASFYAAVGESEENLSINFGTGSQVSFFDRSLTEIQTGEIRPFTERGYLYVQASVNGGKVYERLAEFFQESVYLFTGRKMKKTEIYQKMEEMTIEKTETDLQIFPYLCGSRIDPNCRGEMKGLTEKNFSPSDLIRAFVSGMARELHDTYLQFPEELRRRKKVIVASGNGIRRNALLQQEIEKIFGLPVLLRQVEEEAAVGAAIWTWEEIVREK